MSVLERMTGQHAAVELLGRDVAGDRVAHAYLFGGVGGRLALDAALAFAAALICAEGGCGGCEACRRVANRAHPDVEIVEPAGMQLLVEQVRDVVKTAWRRPVAGRRRVIVVIDADRMNPNAQNAFLKALEEPPASTVIVLVTPNPEVLLETVRSRCREIAFRTPPEADVVAMLVETGASPEDARRWARAVGDPGRAAELVTDPDAQERRTELIDRILSPGPDPSWAIDAATWLAGSTKSIRERLAAAHKEVADEHADWYQETKRASEDRLRREQRRAEQDALEAALDDVASVMRDLVVTASDPSAPLLNPDRGARMAGLASVRGPVVARGAIAVLDEIETARRRLRANANVQLALERVFIAVQRHVGSASV